VPEMRLPALARYLHSRDYSQANSSSTRVSKLWPSVFHGGNFTGKMTSERYMRNDFRKSGEK